MCGYCQKIFSSDYNLDAHINSYHGKNLKKCELIKEVSELKDKLQVQEDMYKIELKEKLRIQEEKYELRIELIKMDFEIRS